MASVSENTIRSSVEATEAFITWYYDALNKGRPVASGYVNGNKTYQTANHAPADIVINGLLVNTPEEWDALLEKQRIPNSVLEANAAKSDSPLVQYHVESWDTHVINADYTFAAPEDLIKKYSKGAGVRMMLLVTASGTVTFGLDKESPSKKQHFHDTFTLVPNWEVIARAGSKATRRYIITSHNYRAYP
ncbi:hypothetical protein QBC37DRAFT_436795 [Rhypophila decipiens]|uniref:NTF2 domain-containing protein n=1 Tax=Rhypophila decipiens TaxID=261697 RepID=A0AAN6YJJ2_9PEZI|nr:hypothetical protein QBC37DRAFT_436795 [Rhypophila decipiens]